MTEEYCCSTLDASALNDGREWVKAATLLVAVVILVKVIDGEIDIRGSNRGGRRSRRPVGCGRQSVRVMAAQDWTQTRSVQRAACSLVAMVSDDEEVQGGSADSDGGRMAGKSRSECPGKADGKICGQDVEPFVSPRTARGEIESLWMRVQRTRAHGEIHPPTAIVPSTPSHHRRTLIRHAEDLVRRETPLHSSSTLHCRPRRRFRHLRWPFRLAHRQVRVGK
nr:hypothetical protein CFP56_34668 [Quercus suber]